MRMLMSVGKWGSVIRPPSERAWMDPDKWSRKASLRSVIKLLVSCQEYKDSCEEQLAGAKVLWKKQTMDGFMAQEGGERFSVWQVQMEYWGAEEAESSRRAGSRHLLGVGRMWTHPKYNEKKPFGIFPQRMTSLFSLFRNNPGAVGEQAAEETESGD